MSEFFINIRKCKKLYCIEEHVVQGSVASEILYKLKVRGIEDFSFVHYYAKKHIYVKSGSQQWLQRQSELDVKSFDSKF